MSKKPRPAKKLRVNKTALRKLTADELDGAAGGKLGVQTSALCYGGGDPPPVRDPRGE